MAEKKTRFSLCQIDTIDEAFIPLLKIQKKLWDNSVLSAQERNNKINSIYQEIIPGLRSKGKFSIYMFLKCLRYLLKFVLGINFESSYLIIRLKSIKDELRRNLKKSPTELATNKRAVKKVREVDFMANFIIGSSRSGSQTQSLNDEPLSQASTYSNFEPNPGLELSSTSLTNNEKIPQFFDCSEDDSHNEVMEQVNQLPAWAKRISTPEELSRQQAIWDKIVAGRSAQGKAQQDTANTGSSKWHAETPVDVANFSKRQKTLPNSIADATSILPEVLSSLQQIAQQQSICTNQTAGIVTTGSEIVDETEKSASDFAKLIVNTLMSIDISKRQSAFNNVLQHGQSYGA